jgi:hypothetical protein
MLCLSCLHLRTRKNTRIPRKTKNSIKCSPHYANSQQPSVSSRLTSAALIRCSSFTTFILTGGRAPGTRNQMTWIPRDSESHDLDLRGTCGVLSHSIRILPNRYLGWAHWSQYDSLLGGLVGRAAAAGLGRPRSARLNLSSAGHRAPHSECEEISNLPSRMRRQQQDDDHPAANLTRNFGKPFKTRTISSKFAIIAAGP